MPRLPGQTWEVPIEPPETGWELPDPESVDDDVIGVGADLQPGTLLAAYRRGLFPMHLDDRLAWWSPVRRGILPLDGLRTTRSLRRSMARFEVRIDTAFEEVIDGCGDPGREGIWINSEIRAAYLELHRLGWVHSVEAWSREDGTLAGGLYGVAIGGLFAGESMFFRQRDASKAALVGLVDAMGGPAGAAEGRVLDVQWVTDHLATLGAVAIGRRAYLQRLRRALALPLPAAFAG